jgi:hypothetical protein
MKAKGIAFVQEPQKADWGTAAIFKDLDGNVFVLATPVALDCDLSGSLSAAERRLSLPSRSSS